MSPRAEGDLTSTNGLPMCLVMAGQPDVQIFVPQGLTPQQTARFVNRHEFRHCLSFSQHGLHDEEFAIKPGEDGKLTAAMFASGAYTLSEETRADVMALMDMVALDGEGTDVIHAIAAWRSARLANSDVLDLLHYSSPALQELARQIDKIGVAQFRAMDAHARDALGEKIIKDYSLSAGTLAQVTVSMFGLDKDTLDEGMRISRDEKHKASAAIALLKTHKHKDQPVVTPVKLSHKQLKQLENWDIAEELVKNATMADGSITRMSLLTARANILDGLRADIAADPSNPIHGARVLMTHQATQNLLRSLDQASREPAKKQQAAPAAPASRAPAP